MTNNRGFRLQLPQEPHAFIDWLEERVWTHPLAAHPLFGYLEEHASFAEMADFFYQESTIDARLDDLLALGQIGMPDRVKLEIGENFWSELGYGDPTMIHTTLFHTLLEALGVQNQNTPATLLPEALACGNLLLLTALHRQYAYVQHGVLATMELMAPARFERIARGGRRLGLPAQALRYLDLHSTLDIQHGNGWRDNVLLPTVETHVAARDDMVKGVFYRLNTSQDYCDALYRRYCRGSLE
jgi:Iron-containing redox enzyme